MIWSKIKSNIDYVVSKLPAVVWEPDEKIRKDNQELTTLVNELELINRGLNIAVGEMQINNEQLRTEVMTVLSAIAMQHAGELIVKNEFFEVLRDKENKNLRLKLEKLENNDIQIKLETVEGEETIPYE